MKLSVVLAAHNEGTVIGRCLDALLSNAAPGEFDVTVVANGCTDDTAAVASARAGVRVVDLAEAGKPGALNAGDRVAEGFPRVYLDADVVVTSAGLREVAAALGPDRPAAVPRRELELTGRPAPVRAFYAINSRLPVYRDGLFGRGLIALSEGGRARFGEFPDQIADDLFLDSLFSSEEKVEVGTVTTRIATPRRTRDLVHRLVRVRRGNAAMRRAAADGVVAARVRPAARLSWLSDVVMPRPWLAPAAACYVAITMTAALAARRAARRGPGWERDESSRSPMAGAPSGTSAEASR
jgi:glycosyltransferase involved in cell wall biosynthesis